MKTKKLLTLILVLLVNSLVFSQQRKIETGDFFISNYNRSFLNTDFLNWSIVQDSEGIIYYGNSLQGVQTFDGQKVRPVLDEKGKPTRKALALRKWKC